MKTILYFLEPRESISITVCNIMEGMIRRYGIEPSAYNTKKGIIEFPFVRVIVYYANSSNLAGLRADEIFGHYPDHLREVVLKDPNGARFIGDFYEYLHLLSIDYRKLEGKKFKIKKVIFNDPATIVLWEDGTKTVVKAQNEDEFDSEKGLAMAISKKALGNKGNYCNEIKKWTEPYEAEVSEIKAFWEFFTKPVGPNPIELAYDALQSIQYPKTTKPIMKQRIDLAIKYLKEALED